MALHQHPYKTARENKDKCYDGKFFFGVKTTGIFCRPSCPSPIAKEKNVQYFDTVFDALESGFRPCLRCRPDIHVDYYNGNVDGTSIVHAALHKIYEGYLNNHSISDLAIEFYVSDRHLRKLFVENIGMPPVKIATYHKALFAKKLLIYSSLPITAIAYASGFGSTRQFNDVFKNIFGGTPTMIRKGIKREDEAGNTTMMLAYEEPFDFEGILAFMGFRAIKGVEVITPSSYSRTFRRDGSEGYFTVTNNREQSALALTIISDDIRCYMSIYNQVRKMFDLDTDFTAINAQFTQDDILSQGMERGHVPRLPIAFDPFEHTIRAILGQQITVKAATTLAGRIVERGNIKASTDLPEGLRYHFPSPEELMALDLDGIGITKTRQRTIENVVSAIVNKEVSLTANQPFDTFYKSFSAIKGVGDWTVNYVAMRGMGMVDSFPAKDLGIIKALTVEDKKPTLKEILSRAEKWRPYRAYAALCLWKYASRKEK